MTKAFSTEVDVGVAAQLYYQKPEREKKKTRQKTSIPEVDVGVDAELYQQCVAHAVRAARAKFREEILLEPEALLQHLLLDLLAQ